MEQDLAAPPSGGLLTETCLSGLPLPGHDLLDGAVSLETRLARPGRNTQSVPAGGLSPDRMGHLRRGRLGDIIESRLSSCDVAVDRRIQSHCHLLVFIKMHQCNKYDNRFFIIIISFKLWLLMYLGKVNRLYSYFYYLYRLIYVAAPLFSRKALIYAFYSP